jgi:hypothetical protein
MVENSTSSREVGGVISNFAFEVLGVYAQRDDFQVVCCDSECSVSKHTVKRNISPSGPSDWMVEREFVFNGANLVSMTDGNGVEMYSFVSDTGIINFQVGYPDDRAEHSLMGVLSSGTEGELYEFLPFARVKCGLYVTYCLEDGSFLPMFVGLTKNSHFTKEIGNHLLKFRSVPVLDILRRAVDPWSVVWEESSIGVRSLRSPYQVCEIREVFQDPSKVIARSGLDSVPVVIYRDDNRVVLLGRFASGDNMVKVRAFDQSDGVSFLINYCDDTFKVWYPRALTDKFERVYRLILSDLLD